MVYLGSTIRTVEGGTRDSVSLTKQQLVRVREKQRRCGEGVAKEDNRSIH